jgi:crotonobetainyl-CoA:carnitine CoA-transferase CaiB-like acyl-CoA transferase
MRPIFVYSHTHARQPQGSPSLTNAISSLTRNHQKRHFIAAFRKIGFKVQNLRTMRQIFAASDPGNQFENQPDLSISISSSKFKIQN